MRGRYAACARARRGAPPSSCDTARTCIRRSAQSSTEVDNSGRVTDNRTYVRSREPRRRMSSETCSTGGFPAEGLYADDSDAEVCSMSMDHVDLYNQHAAEEARAAGLMFAPSSEEISLLGEHEPGVQFRPVRNVAMTPGRQSRVSVLEYDRQGTTYRVVWKRMGADKRLDLDEAKAMRERLSPYRTSLESSGWHVPKLFFSEVEKLNNEFQVFSYEEFIPGGDAEHMIADPTEPNFRKWYVIEKVLRLLYSYPGDQLTNVSLLGRDLTLLPHGLDLKLANLVLEPSDNQLYFVDLFGPKELTPDGGWRIYSPKLDSLPPDNLRVVTATREGAILRFWRLARKTWEPVRERRPLLLDDFLDRLAVCDPTSEELGVIREDLTSNFAWLNTIYSERKV